MDCPTLLADGSGIDSVSEVHAFPASGKAGCSDFRQHMKDRAAGKLGDGCIDRVRRLTAMHAPAFSKEPMQVRLILIAVHYAGCVKFSVRGFEDPSRIAPAVAESTDPSSTPSLSSSWSNWLSGNARRPMNRLMVKPMPHSRATP